MGEEINPTVFFSVLGMGKHSVIELCSWFIREGTRSHCEREHVLESVVLAILGKCVIITAVFNADAPYFLTKHRLHSSNCYQYSYNPKAEFIGKSEFQGITSYATHILIILN